MMPLWTTTMRPVQSRCGMGVLLGRAAVRGPARVPDAVLAVERVGLDGVFEPGELAGAPAEVDSPLSRTTATPAES